MILVLATAIATWALMQILDYVNLGGFLLESTVAVVGGAAFGLLYAWYSRRRARQARRA